MPDPMSLPYVGQVDYGVLNSARRTLSTVADSLADAVVDATNHRSASFGRCEEACEQARHAIFHALNLMAEYLDDQEAREAINVHRSVQP